MKARRGICQVRFNQGGKLRVPWGYVAGLQADPIEKKPFFHVLPGSDALTFGMLGCDFHCANCQNWVSSQMLRDPAADESIGYLRRISPEQMVLAAKRSGASVIASSYNEPLITSEWAVSIFKLAVEQGIKCVYVSNGNATPQVLDYLRPYLSAYKIDLKTMRDKQYRQLGGVLKNVLDTIRRAHELGLWVEVVTLVIPGFNDSTEELLDAGRFITSVSPDIPWHVTAFHPDYKMTEPHPTPVKTLQRAAEIGQEVGPQIRLRRQPARQPAGIRKHLLPQMPDPAGGAHGLRHPPVPADGYRCLPEVRHENTRYLDGSTRVGEAWRLGNAQDIRLIRYVEESHALSWVTCAA